MFNVNIRKTGISPQIGCWIKIKSIKLLIDVTIELNYFTIYKIAKKQFKVAFLIIDFS